LYVMMITGFCDKQHATSSIGVIVCAFGGQL
jgi:hypothetical protein